MNHSVENFIDKKTQYIVNNINIYTLYTHKKIKSAKTVMPV